MTAQITEDGVPAFLIQDPKGKHERILQHEGGLWLYPIFEDEDLTISIATLVIEYEGWRASIELDRTDVLMLARHLDRIYNERFDQ